MDLCPELQFRRRRIDRDESGIVRFAAVDEFLSPMTGGKNVELDAATEALVELELLLDRRDRLRKPDLVLFRGVLGPTKEQIQLQVALALAERLARSQHEHRHHKGTDSEPLHS